MNLARTTVVARIARLEQESVIAGYGVRRINVSLDTLDPDKFHAVTRWGQLSKVLEGIDAAQAAGLSEDGGLGRAEGADEGTKGLKQGTGFSEEEAEREERSSRMRMPCRESQSSIP